MLQPLSILVVTDVWKWFAEAEQLAIACEVLAARGHHLEVACQPESPVRDRLETVVARFHDLPGLRGPTTPLAPLANLQRLRAVITRGGFDLVHAYRSPPHLLAVAALRTLGWRRPGLVRTRGGAQAVTGGAANRLVYGGLTDAVLATSRTIRDDLLERLALSPSAVTLLPNVVALERLAGADGAAFRAEVQLPPEGLVVGVLGRFARVKGHRVLIEALPRLLSAHRDLRVCLVGPEDDGAEVEALARAESLGVRDHVVLVGARSDPASVLAAFDVVAVPSLGSEVIARVPLEAMALGRPVVASRVGVLPEIVREESGWLVPPGDAEALAIAILAALDPTEGARKGAAAAAQVQAEHRPEHLADALESAYSRVLSGRRPRRSTSSVVE